MKEIDTDILIVGAGLVGLVAAHSLSLLKYNVVIVDKKDLNDPKSSPKDIRTVAVSQGSKQFLENIFLWNGIKESAEAIKIIKVFDRDQSNKIIFENFKKEKKLGYVIENSKFSKSLLISLKKKKNVKIFYGSELTKIDQKNTFAKTYFKNYIINSKLIIAADGKHSSVRKIVGNKILTKNYPESALVLNFFHENNLNNTAYEIFSNTGPLAILPMKFSNKFFQSSIIWSNKNSFINKIINCNNEFIANIVYEKVGMITGNIIKINSKQKFPISAHINDSFFSKRLIYIGDSAHSIHPIAGQGWNLGIKDIKNLNLVFNDYILKKQEIGNDIFCKEYNSLSYKNAFQLFQITDKLDSHFKRKENLYRFLSNTGINFIESSEKIKNKITEYAMGF
ncbi:FAD-dependent monooxygenase [Alphaproteobacteria bacterium]|nr:FAD-dependent monooxygenase [Alphaproteobacteria bacterium]